MLTIDDYVNRALKALDIKSDVQLCRRLEISTVQVCSWRKRKSIPSDENMAKLAQFAKMDVEFALLHLSWWRSVSRNEHLAATSYQKLIESYQSIAA